MREGDPLSRVVLEAAVEVTDAYTADKIKATAQHGAVATADELFGTGVSDG